MSTAAFISRRVVFPDSIRPAAVLVDSDSGRILRIAEADAPGPAGETIDVGDCALLPGLVDTHVHINEPGRADWEGFTTATRAAAAGGITTLVDMPLNCLPETTTVASLEAKRAAAAGKCRVDWRAWGGAVGTGTAPAGQHAGNQDHIAALAAAGAAGFKCFLVYPGCEGLGPIDELNLRSAMPLIAATGLRLLVHAELPGPLEAAAATLSAPGTNWRSYATYLASRPDEAEVQAIRLMIRLTREFKAQGHDCRVHIVHVSSAKALPLLRAAREEGLRITAETCPHYLFFSAEEIPDGDTLFKCAPPIRDIANRELLWEGVRDGTLDLIVSDHSPSTPEMKRGLAVVPASDPGDDAAAQSGSFQTAWGGIASLSVSVPAVWTAMSQRGFSLCDLARTMSTNPAYLAGLGARKGRIAAGLDADFAVFDSEKTFTVESAKLHFRHPISPYLGARLHGVVQQTWLRGTCIWDGANFFGRPIGREVPLDALRPAAPEAMHKASI